MNFNTLVFFTTFNFVSQVLCLQSSRSAVWSPLITTYRLELFQQAIRISSFVSRCSSRQSCFVSPSLTKYTECRTISWLTVTVSKLCPPTWGVASIPRTFSKIPYITSHQLINSTRELTKLKMCACPWLMMGERRSVIRWLFQTQHLTRWRTVTVVREVAWNEQATANVEQTPSTRTIVSELLMDTLHRCYWILMMTKSISCNDCGFDGCMDW